MKVYQKYAVFITGLLFITIATVGCSTSNNASNANSELILATTTSTQDSGLLDVLIPVFEEETGYMVKTIAVGTGKALAMGEQGEADVLLVHAPEAEMVLVNNEDAVNRQLVMHNDFILVGPKEDPARIKEIFSTEEAFKTLA